MLKPQLHQTSQSTKTLIPWNTTKPFISGEILASFPINILNKNLRQKPKKNFRVHYAANSTKAVLSSTEKSTSAKAVVTVQKTVGGTNLALTRGLDDIGDLLGKTLLLGIVAAELDPKTGIKKPSIKTFARRGRDVDGDTHYEADFVIPEDFGEVGAILVENEHHKEMYVKNIVIDGFPHGIVHITCNSWVHSKFDNPEKRIFFTNKVCKKFRLHLCFIYFTQNNYYSQTSL
uniref:Linoleate 13S-lipoxygenase 2-1, chloroplastic-like n=1 Tax=Nicotiana tabacum TaxID=4097 RepID=A0A1S3YKZ9_TOBAC|nr:PREDICTED: linoleate 13S-lipoxygenase 2-1, chloroplastic-like [Nicotiana tabacum]